MTNYIKVRPHVAQRLGILNARYRYADGCCQLWERDLSVVDPGYVFRKQEVVDRIGGLMMDPHRNREEQEKTARDCTRLPEPTDPDWRARPDEEWLNEPFWEEEEAEDNAGEGIMPDPDKPAEEEYPKESEDSGADTDETETAEEGGDA